MSDKLEFTVFLVNHKLENDLGIDLGTSGEIEARETVRVKDIESVREAADDDDIIKGRCSIRTTSGQSFHVKGSYEEIMKKLEINNWQ